jgi:chemotaxis receptor (MCP) glutamine deamidase CheD
LFIGGLVGVCLGVCVGVCVGVVAEVACDLFHNVSPVSDRFSHLNEPEDKEINSPSLAQGAF